MRNKHDHVIIVVIALMIIVFASLEAEDTKPTEGKFIIDSIYTEFYPSFKDEYRTEAVRPSITLSVMYHFENYPGTLSSIGIRIPVDRSGMDMCIDYLGAFPTDTVFTESISCPLKFNPFKEDSVLVECEFKGEFYSKAGPFMKDNGPVWMGNFRETINVMIPVSKE